MTKVVPFDQALATAMGTIRKEEMAISNSDRFPTRLASLTVMEFLWHSMVQAKTSLDLDYDEVLIASFIASRSTENLLNNRYEASHYGFEDDALPEDERFCVSMKDIVSNLSIPRETVRRKLLILLDRKIIVKTADGYMFPPQLEGMDVTGELRKSIVGSLKEFLNKIDRIYQIR